MSTEDPTTPSGQSELDPLARVRGEGPERPAESVEAAESANPAELAEVTEPAEQTESPTPAAELLGDPDLGGDPNLLGSVDVTGEPVSPVSQAEQDEVAGASADRPEELLDAPVSDQAPEQVEQVEPASEHPAANHRAHAAAAAAGPVMAPFGTSGAGSAGPDQQQYAGSADSAAYPAQPAQFGLSDQESQALVKSSWRWAALTVFFFALLTIWAAPAAAMVSQRLGAGDVAGARAHAKTAKTLGVVSIVVFVVMMALWFGMMLALTAAGIEGFEAGAGGSTSTT